MLDKIKKIIFKNKFETYILRLENEDIAKIKYENGNLSFLEIYNFQKLPPFLMPQNSTKSLDILSKHLNAWFEYRKIENLRPNIDELLKKIKLDNLQMLSIKSLALSLQDQYWLCPTNFLNLRFEDINYFDNGFCSDIGDILFDPDVNKLNIDVFSPDNTTNGMDPKRWILDKNNHPFLIKTNINLEQVALNEKIANILSNVLQLKHVNYTTLRSDITIKEDGISKLYNCLFAVSPCFCDKKHTFANANLVKSSFENKEKYYDFIKNNKNLKDAFNKMIILDYLMIQEDRHDNNYGFLINNQNNEIELIVFDSGNSLGYDNNKENGIFPTDFSKVFRKTHTECLEFVDDFDFIEFKKIKETILQIKSILNESNLTEKQKENIIKLYEKRIECLEQEIAKLIERKNNLDKEIEFYKSKEKNELPEYKIENGKLILNASAELECLDLIKNGIIKHKNQYPAYKDKEKENER